MENIATQMTVYQRYQEFRLDISKEKFVPSGWNGFGGFKYFELGDFHDKAMELLAKHELCYVPPEYDEEEGYPRYVAKVITYDGMQELKFKEKVKESNHSKSETQNYGGTISYYERFILKKICGITDKDEVDAVDSSKLEPREEPKATEKQIALISQVYDLENIEKIKEYYHVEKLEDLTVKQASECLSKKGKK